MNITFFIGNGFDVGLGLRSRFKDFFPIYVGNSKNKDKNIRVLSERIGKDYDTWSNFEERMGQYTIEFSPTEWNNLVFQFRDFEEEFIQYLQSEVEKLSFNNQNQIASMMCKALDGFYGTENLRPDSSSRLSAIFSNRRNEDHYYNFLCFNYTDLLEKCLDTIPKGVIATHLFSSTRHSSLIRRIVHVHGRCEDAPIMGVDNIEQIANKALASNALFTRYIVKPKLNELHRSNHDAEGEKVIAESHIICIYGMALGKTDKCWWARVLKWLIRDSNRQLVIFDYDPNFKNSNQFDWIDKEDEILSKLSEYIPDNMELDIDTLRSRIHIAVHKNIFEMRLSQITEEEYKNVLNKAQLTEIDKVI